eukprot:CAMPEP_0170587378 /NCGR_PEP_ID=MMETSP0224-20130122/10252_1 /TAXON_ID=285029 /ORGANISM="Togula jolla, Strain CCCM 725" /LENGTH=98 /DNA_ID=CAMNT_0010910999 /DNA_START=39 /DNA_END=332 /DNA_ORIENTATION=+
MPYKLRSRSRRPLRTEISSSAGLSRWPVGTDDPDRGLYGELNNGPLATAQMTPRPSLWTRSSGDARTTARPGPTRGAKLVPRACFAARSPVDSAPGGW